MSQGLSTTRGEIRSLHATPTRRQFIGRATTLLSGVGLAAGGLAACSAPGRAALDSSSGRAAESIHEFLTSAVPEGAGLTALAAHRGEIVYCNGVGWANRAPGIGAGCDTVYDIGSITKQFTAAAILKLQMAGKLAMTDPVRKFADDWPADKREITLHQLLTHTAGLIDHLGGDYDVLSRDDMLATAAGSELLSAPGAEYHYSNLGYSVLAAVIEKVSGVGYETYLAEHLFAPAGMTQTGYVLPYWDPIQVAVEYDTAGTPRGRPNERPWGTDGPHWNLRGNGGILSTAPDMYRWHLALDGRDVLSQAAKRKLFEPYVREGDGDTYYGYGWVVMFDDGNKIVWHNGGNGRSFAVFTKVPKEGLMTFWATNHVEQDGRWNLEDLDLTQEVLDRLRDPG